MKDKDFERYDIRLTNFENEISGYQIGAVLPIESSRFSKISLNAIEYQGLEIMISAETTLEELETIVINDFVNSSVTFDLDISAQIYARVDVEFDNSGQPVATRLDMSSLEIERLDKRINVWLQDEHLVNDCEDELLEDISIEDLILKDPASREIIQKLVNDAKFVLETEE